jgi:hypothetical protein
MTTTNKQLATTILEIRMENYDDLSKDQRDALHFAAKRLQEIHDSPLTANPTPLTAKEVEEALRPKPTTEPDSYKFPVGTVFVVDRKKFGGEPIGSTKDHNDAVRNAKASSATGCPAYVLACLHKVTCVPNPTYKVEAP